jgi:hypothetical protein
MKTYGGVEVSYYSWSRHVMEMSDKLHAPVALFPGKEPQVPIGYEALWAPGPIWTSKPWPITIPTKLSQLPVVSFTRTLYLLLQTSLQITYCYGNIKELLLNL